MEIFSSDSVSFCDWCVSFPLTLRAFHQHIIVITVLALQLSTDKLLNFEKGRPTKVKVLPLNER